MRMRMQHHISAYYNLAIAFIDRLNQFITVVVVFFATAAKQRFLRHQSLRRKKIGSKWIKFINLVVSTVIHMHSKKKQPKSIFSWNLCVWLLSNHICNLNVEQLHFEMERHYAFCCEFDHKILSFRMIRSSKSQSHTLFFI